MNSTNLIWKNNFITADGLHLPWRRHRHLEKVFHSDEAWLHVSGYMNSQISRIWIAENLHTFHEKLLHSLEVGGWHAVSQWRITAPIFFSEMITAEHYQELTELHFPSGS
jgi:hypothetical protein